MEKNCTAEVTDESKFVKVVVYVLILSFNKYPNVIGCYYQQQMIIASFSSKSKNNKNQIEFIILQNILRI